MRYFGTDGIRGKVGVGTMQADFVLRLGRAAGRVLCPDGGTVVVGKDTRISGYMFEAALEAGFSSAGVDILMLGPLPTPGIAHLATALGADAGVVISASHNPYEDNGLKFFDGNGSKLPDETEAAIEVELERAFETVPPDRLGRARRVDDAVERYSRFCLGTFDEGMSLRGMKLVLDCANGATYRVAPRVFEALGAEVSSIGVDPDGLNINRGAGSTDTRKLAQTVIAQGADLGIAFDGDGDRVQMVGPDGHTLDGDDLLYVIACDRQDNGGMDAPLVGTVMSNLGLERALDARGIRLMRASVGDRHVLQMMRTHGGVIGGEPSGHIICLDRCTTGDGIVAALQVLAAVARSGRTVQAMAAQVEKLPQVMINVSIAVPLDLDADPGIREAVASAEDRLGPRGRVLLRASGTEPVVRVMVEGDDAAEVESVCAGLAAVVDGLNTGGTHETTTGRG